MDFSDVTDFNFRNRFQINYKSLQNRIPLLVDYYVHRNLSHEITNSALSYHKCTSRHFIEAERISIKAVSFPLAQVDNIILPDLR